MKDYYGDYHFYLDYINGKNRDGNNNGSIYKEKNLLSVKSPDFYNLYNLIEEYNIDENTLLYDVYVEKLNEESVIYKKKLCSAQMLIDKIYGMEMNHKKFIIRYQLFKDTDCGWSAKVYQDYDKEFEENVKFIEDFILINLPPYKFKSYYLASLDNYVNYFYELN